MGVAEQDAGVAYTIGDGPNSSRLLFRRKKLQCLALDHDIVGPRTHLRIEKVADDESNGAILAARAAANQPRKYFLRRLRFARNFNRVG